MRQDCELKETYASDVRQHNLVLFSLQQYFTTYYGFPSPWTRSFAEKGLEQG